MQATNKIESSQTIIDSGPIINGKQQASKECMPLYSPYDNRHFANLALANCNMVEKSIHQAQCAFVKTKALSSYQRSQI